MAPHAGNTHHQISLPLFHRCFSCPKTFDSAKALRNHHKTVHFKYKCDKCGQGFNNSLKFGDHCKKHGITHPFECVECKKTYTNEGAMKVHQRTHQGYVPYECRECGLQFELSSALSTHLQFHAEQVKNICSICGKVFKTKRILSSHLQIHDARGFHSCEICGKQFPRKSNLKRHARTHTGETPFACTYCEKTFTRQEKCLEHQRTHTKERPFVCEECGACFSDSGNFCNHKKIHTKVRPPRKRHCAEKSYFKSDTPSSESSQSDFEEFQQICRPMQELMEAFRGITSIFSQFPVEMHIGPKTQDLDTLNDTFNENDRYLDKGEVNEYCDALFNPMTFFPFIDTQRNNILSNDNDLVKENTTSIQSNSVFRQDDITPVENELPIANFHIDDYSRVQKDQFGLHQLSFSFLDQFLHNQSAIVAPK